MDVLYLEQVSILLTIFVTFHRHPLIRTGRDFNITDNYCDFHRHTLIRTFNITDNQRRISILLTTTDSLWLVAVASGVAVF